ncbi:MAG: outer membrane protein assembly factor BamE [Rhizobiaceae bacterium]|nr:MAG: outer membrane protein assembly factor BamE [Rhizobiaceae bacterium]CAG0956501.1 hypothetical protein RHIZO_00473 [Rhizobiaceae bacterium]
MDLSSPLQDFKTGSSRRAAIAASLVAATAALSACSTSGALNPRETLAQGYVVDQQQIDLVPVGSSREQVLLTLGSPSTTATFDNEVFYYISQTRVRSVAFMNPRLVDQRVLAVYFGEDGRVNNIAHYGMQDGKVFDFISRTTPTGGKDQTFIGQLLSGVAGGGASQARRALGG